MEASEKKIKNLIECGIRTFINLQGKDEVNFEGVPFLNYQAILKKFEKEYKIKLSFNRLSIPDFGITSTKNMKKILDTIDKSIGQGKPVYVHCWGGIGRTGTVVSCFLLRHGMANHDNVFKMIEYLRRSDPENHRLSPETPEQFEFVKNWKE
ncbi:MAG: hypothetical protein A2W91_11205 [Bacteroidetes bacterium GWF2_38_335]|nr:MAG: hypothetical protein A2W91_11205 [Bacteroidetes bacterium GWF2_38_335]OFY81915.1 MAG: hypothetical protein A2281_05835 [Bacteroidetes bacterium RIFOXYA12_FULL_38_20]